MFNEKMSHLKDHLLGKLKSQNGKSGDTERVSRKATSFRGENLSLKRLSTQKMDASKRSPSLLVFGQRPRAPSVGTGPRHSLSPSLSQGFETIEESNEEHELHPVILSPTTVIEHTSSIKE